MYTSNIENLQHRSMLETRTSVNQRRQIADIDFVKNSKQRATTLKSDPHKLPWTTTHAADVGGRPAGGVRKDTATVRCQIWCYLCDTELKLVLFACGGRHGGSLSPTGCLFGYFRRQITVVEIIIANLHRLYVCSCNCCCECGLCRRTMHVRDVRSCTISYSNSLGPSAQLSSYIISMANSILQHLSHLTNV